MTYEYFSRDINMNCQFWELSEEHNISSNMIVIFWHLLSIWISEKWMTPFYAAAPHLYLLATEKHALTRPPPSLRIPSLPPYPSPLPHASYMTFNSATELNQPHSHTWFCNFTIIPDREALNSFTQKIQKYKISMIKGKWRLLLMFRI